MRTCRGAHQKRERSTTGTVLAGIGLLGALGCGTGADGDDGALAAAPASQAALASIPPGITSVKAAAPTPGGAAGAACSKNVARQNQNGPLMTQPKVFFLFWTSYWASGTGATECTNLTNVWSNMAGDAGFYNQMSEYGIGHGVFLNTSNPSPNLGTKTIVSESTIQSLLTGEIGVNGVPSNDSNTLYVIMMPKGKQSGYDCTSTSCTSLGHHGFATKNNTPVRYAVIEYNASLDTTNTVVSHEIYEAVTDPDEGSGPGGSGVFGTGWRDAGAGTTDEIGDICNLIQQTYHGVVIQQVWSQSSCACRTAPQVAQPTTNVSFDGDAKSDQMVFRPSNGTWFSHPSNGGFDQVTQFGVITDVPVTRDYTGDGKNDVAVFRSGTWFIHPSEGGGDTVVALGSITDVLVPGDYTGDHKADIAVYRPSTGTWTVRPSGGGVQIVMQFGVSTDLPVPGDYTGDGKVDFAVFRPSTGQWFVRPTSGGGDIVTQFGVSTDMPAPGDYTGDGKFDVTVFRPSTGQWFVHPSNGGGDIVTQFGVSTDMIPFR